MDTVLKVKLWDTVHRIPLPQSEEVSLESVLNVLHRLHPDVQATARYRDDEGDLCSLCPETFSDFLSLAASANSRKVLKVELVPDPRGHCPTCGKPEIHQELGHVEEMWVPAGCDDRKGCSELPRATFKPTMSYALESVNAPGMFLAVEYARAWWDEAWITLTDKQQARSARWHIAQVSEDVYTVESAGLPGMFLNVRGGRQHRGTPVQLYGNPESPHTQWRIKQVSLGVFTFESANAAWHFLNVRGGGSWHGATIHTWTNPESPHTQWRILEGAGHDKEAARWSGH